MFKFEDYKGDYCMHCKTEEEAKEFCNLMHEDGKKWFEGRSYLETTHWKCFKDKTCYFFNNNTFEDLERANNINYTILEWSDFQDKTCEFCKYQLTDADDYPCNKCCNRYENKFKKMGKTRQDKFLEVFPDTELDKDGIIVICPRRINKNLECPIYPPCADCRKKYWHEEVE